MRMKSGVPIADVASVAGTSVSHIETHYRHIDDDDYERDWFAKLCSRQRECGDQ